MKVDSNDALLIIPAAILAIALYFNRPSQSYLKPARGIRNNNPLNIKYNPNNRWVGANGVDGPFVVFTSPTLGIRAAFKILANYKKRGLKSINQIINTWAPPSENNTNNYIKFVANKLELKPDSPIPDSKIPQLIQAMAHFENGKPISINLIKKAQKLV